MVSIKSDYSNEDKSVMYYTDIDFNFEVFHPLNKISNDLGVPDLVTDLVIIHESLMYNLFIRVDNCII